MGSFSLSGVFTALSDPDSQPYGIPERGAFIGGKPVRQGYESALLKFTPLTTGAYNELRARYEANKNAQTSGNVPAVSGYGWRACSAFWHEPMPAGWDGPIVLGVTMIVSHIGYY